MIMNRYLQGLAASIASCVLLVLPAQAAAPAASEYAVKAAIVYKLTKFVNWPDAAFSGSDDRLIICIGRNSDFLPAMRTLDGRSAQGRTVEVVVLGSGEPAESRCHVLFVSDSDRQLLDTALRAVADAPVLTVGEGNAFVEHGGIIGLQIEQNRVAFAVNLMASERAGLGISARLLQLATIVRSGGAS